MIGTLGLRVAAIRAEARDVMALELRSADGAPLPAFQPGAHLEIELPPERAGLPALVRRYSICNDCAEADRYLIAVGLDAASRGGSRAVHSRLRVDALVRARVPRNHFALVPNADCYRFVAGGIGITPILSMIRWCEANGRAWSLLYCTRSRLRTAFLEDLQRFGDRVSFHFADEHQGRRADLVAALSAPRPDEHLYCCGPAPLMWAAERTSSDWPAAQVHFEWFAAPDETPADPSAARAFDVVLRRSGTRLRVEANASILETLEQHGVGVPFSCREGLCRTCETGLCAGEADHRDTVLSEAERAAQSSLMVCVSRAHSAVLELDL